MYQEQIAAAGEQLRPLLRELGIPSQLNIYFHDGPYHIGLMLTAAERVAHAAKIPAVIADVPIRIYGAGRGGALPIDRSKLDGKFYGIVRRDNNDELIPSDCWVAFMAYDKAFLPTLFFYKSECQRQGAPQSQIDAVSALISRVETWQKLNPDKMRVPGSLHPPTPQQLTCAAATT